MQARVRGQEAIRHFRSLPVAPGRQGRLKTIDDFRCDAVYAGDGNRIDLAYAVYALAHGVDEMAVRYAIETRDLSKKGSEARQEAYVGRTISKARERVGPARSR